MKERDKSKGGQVLRHGWGGDKNARKKALREKEQNERERKTHPFANIKFG